jgi:outer membrane lipoprotein-sorting protein
VLMVWQSHLVLLCLASVSAVAGEAAEHLKRAANAYSRLKSLQVEAVAERRTGDDRTLRTVVVRLYASGRGKARIETSGPNEPLQSVLVSNGKTVTEYRRWTNQYTRLPATGLSIQFTPDRATGWGEMSYETIADDIGRASVRGRQILHIGEDRIACIVVGVEYVGRISKYAFWIAEDSGLILRRVVTFWSEQGTETVISTVRAMTINEAIADSVFEFAPPPGAREVQLSAETTAGLPLQ